MITVYYEDLIADLTSEFHRITDFLGLEFSAPLSHLRRQNPERLSDLIMNYESLKRGFADTEWSDFFED